MAEKPTVHSILSALLTLAERHQQPGESLEQAFARVVNETHAGRRLFNAFKEAERARPTLRLTGR